MGSSRSLDPIGEALFPASRREVLHLLYGHVDRAFYVREIVQRIGLGYGHVQRELARLHGGGILTRKEQGRHVYFQANRECPIFEDLRALVTKTVGAAGRLRAALFPLAASIDLAFIYGSVARGEATEASDLDVLVIGDVSLAEIVRALREVEGDLGREVIPTVYSPAEAQAKAGGHFLESVVRGERVFILGEERDLERVLAQPLDPGARDLPERDQGPFRRRGS